MQTLAKITVQPPRKDQTASPMSSNDQQSQGVSRKSLRSSVYAHLKTQEDEEGPSSTSKFQLHSY